MTNDTNLHGVEREDPNLEAMRRQRRERFTGMAQGIIGSLMALAKELSDEESDALTGRAETRDGAVARYAWDSTMLNLHVTMSTGQTYDMQVVAEAGTAFRADGIEGNMDPAKYTDLAEHVLETLAFIHEREVRSAVVAACPLVADAEEDVGEGNVVPISSGTSQESVDSDGAA